MSNNDGLVAIGELARRTATPTSALRYYERIGLLPAAERASGRRRYRPDSAERLALIRLCQDAGFTLREIQQLVQAKSRRRATWNQLAKHKLVQLDARIAQAHKAKNLLMHALTCPNPDLLTCPKFQAELAARLDSTAAPVAGRVISQTRQ
jgi:MerR family redox-sensitive transcriptional activator SoxR